MLADGCIDLASKDTSSAPSLGVAHPTSSHFRWNCPDAASIEHLNGMSHESTDAMPDDVMPDVDTADATFEIGRDHIGMTMTLNLGMNV